MFVIDTNLNRNEHIIIIYHFIYMLIMTLFNNSYYRCFKIDVYISNKHVNRYECNIKSVKQVNALCFSMPQVCRCPARPFPSQIAEPNEEDPAKMFLFIRSLI